MASFSIPYNFKFNKAYCIMIHMIKTLQENIPLIESLFLASKMYFCIIVKKIKKIRITFKYLLIFQEHLLDRIDLGLLDYP